MKKIMITFVLLATASVSAHAFSGKGAGTEKDPYQITNADELFEIRNELTACYKLMNDIDLTEFIAEDNPSQGWSPIGNVTTPFQGKLDGNNRVVKGLYINRPTMDNVGLFGCVAGSKINNIAILNARLTGKNNVGALAGILDTHVGERNGFSNYINDVIIQGAYVSCEENGGCVAGAITSSVDFRGVGMSDLDLMVKGCNVSGSVNAGNNAGGICGLVSSGKYRWYESSFSWGSGSYGNFKVTIEDNVVDCDIISSGIAGGVAACIDGWERIDTPNWRQNWLDLDFVVQRNIVMGTVSGQRNVCGIVGRIRPSFDNENYIKQMILVENVALLDSIRSKEKEIYRVANRAFTNNYAFVGMVGQWEETPISFEDNDFNGMSYGLKTLRKRTTYEGMGYDFASQWSIKENSSVPYNKLCSEPPVVDEFVGGSRGYISGSASDPGQVYVYIGGNMFESYVVDGKWKVELGNITEGTEAKVSVAAEGKLPSLTVSALAEKPAPDVSGKAGDANGDGVVDAADVVGIINYIIGKPSASFNALNADINGDGQVLVDDAVGAVELIMKAQ